MVWDLYIHGDASPFSLSKIKSTDVAGTVKHIKRNGKRRNVWFNFPFRICAIPLGFIIQFVIAVRLFLKGAEPERGARIT